MSEQSIVRPDGLARAGVGIASRSDRAWSWLGSCWGIAVASIAVVSAAGALWVTLHADFLAHPAWLAVQKADFIVGPVFVGLYWWRRRPGNRFGLLLIALGLVGGPYILQALTQPTLFAIGVVTEDPLWVMATIVILAFPTGRLTGLPERVVIAFLVVVMLVVLAVTLSVSHLAPGLSISQCRDACPGARLGLSECRAPDRLFATLPVPISLGTACVSASRLAPASPPRRRALAIGTPIGLLFVLVQATQQTLVL